MEAAYGGICGRRQCLAGASNAATAGSAGRPSAIPSVRKVPFRTD